MQNIFVFPLLKMHVIVFARTVRAVSFRVLVSVNFSPLVNTCAGELLTNLQVDLYVLDINGELGEIVMVKLQKEKFVVRDDWYCRYITVATSDGQCVEFPCFRWLEDDKEMVLRDGRGGVQSGCSVLNENHN